MTLARGDPCFKASRPGVEPEPIQRIPMKLKVIWPPKNNWAKFRARNEWLFPPLPRVPKAHPHQIGRAPPYNSGYCTLAGEDTPELA